MRLSFLKDKELPLKELQTQVNELLELPFADMLRSFPQAALLFAECCAVLTDGDSAEQNKLKFAEEFFYSKLVGKHYELRGLFADFCNFEPEKCFIGPCRITAVSGIGTDGCVFRTADGYALKCVPLSKREKICKEYDFLSRTEHENIVRVRNIFYGADFIAFEQEMLNHSLGKLSDYISGIEYCHAQGYLHGDIRLKNLGVNEQGVGKIFDFGNMRKFKSFSETRQEKILLKNVFNSPVSSYCPSLLSAGGVLC